MAYVCQRDIINDYEAGNITLDEIIERSKEKEHKFGNHTRNAQTYWKAYCRIKSGDYYSKHPYIGKSFFAHDGFTDIRKKPNGFFEKER